MHHPNLCGAKYYFLDQVATPVMAFALFLTKTVTSIVVSVSIHRKIMNVFQNEPIISKDVFVAPADMGDMCSLAGVLLFGMVLF